MVKIMDVCFRDIAQNLQFKNCSSAAPPLMNFPLMDRPMASRSISLKAFLVQMA